MASAFMLDIRSKPVRVKKLAKPTGIRITHAEVVNRLYRDFPHDMSRLAE